MTKAKIDLDFYCLLLVVLNLLEMLILLNRFTADSVFSLLLMRFNVSFFDILAQDVVVQYLKDVVFTDKEGKKSTNLKSPVVLDNSAG